VGEEEKESSIHLLETQQKLELRIRKLTEQNASFEELEKAHDDFHAFILKHGVRGKSSQGFIYKNELSPIDTFFIKRIGNGKSVLEIGLGDGIFLTSCAKKGNKVQGIDISSIIIDRINRILKNEKVDGRVKLGDARVLTFSNETFNVVVSKDLVEHLLEKDLPTHLNEVWRILKPGGYYLIWTPSSLLGHTSLGAHLKEYTLSEILAALSNANFMPKLMNLHIYRLSGIDKQISNRLIILFVLGYEKLLNRCLTLINIQIQNPAIYLIVPPICIAAYKGFGRRECFCKVF